MGRKEDKATLERQITTLKTKITKSANLVANNANVDETLIETTWNVYKDNATKIDDLYNDIIQIVEEDELTSQRCFDDHVLDGVIGLQLDYKLEIGHKMAEFKKKYLTDEVQQTAPVTNNACASLNPSPFQRPTLEVPHFSDNKNDPCEYMFFKTALISVLQNMREYSEVDKFTILLQSLGGRARSLVSNRNINDQSIKNAFEVLDATFLDESLIVEKIINFLKNYPNMYTCNSVEEFVTILRCKLADLKQFAIDFEEERSAGNILLSNIIRAKLPEEYLKELKRRTIPYPSVQDLLKHSNDIGKFFAANDYNINKKEKNAAPQQYGAKGGNSANKPPNVNRQNNFSNSNHAFNNQGANSGGRAIPCRFCSNTAHITTHCDRYTTHNDRKARAKTLGKCIRCLNSSHADCAGSSSTLPFICSFCKSNKHCTPMCPGYVYKVKDNSKNTTS